MAASDNSIAAKKALREELEAGNLMIAQALRRMRKIAGMNQTDCTKKIVATTHRICMEYERGQGNPTVETLNKIAGPFGYGVGFVKEKPT